MNESTGTICSMMTRLILRLRWLLVVYALSCAAVTLAQGSERDRPAAQRDFQGEGKSAAGNRSAQREKPKADLVKDAGEKTAAAADERLKLDRQIAEYNRQLAAYSLEVAKYAREVADVTFWLMLATVGIALAGVWQGFVLTRSIYLAREKFMASRRPKLILREAHVVENGAFADASYTISNIGDSAAEIVESAFFLEAFPRDKPSQKRPVSDARNDMGQRWIEAGESHTADFAVTPGRKTVRPPYKVAEGQALFFSGRIVYADYNGTRRTMSFYRRSEQDQFVRFSASDHLEYSD